MVAGQSVATLLGNGTAADVAIFHSTPAGGAGAIYIETKYYEDMSAEASGMKPRYDEVAAASGCFRDDALPRLKGGWLQQLWLDHLLLLATRQTDRLAAGLFVVTYPAANPRCRAAAQAYAATLSPSGLETFEARTLEDLVDVMDRQLGQRWISSFRERYLSPA